VSKALLVLPPLTVSFGAAGEAEDLGVAPEDLGEGVGEALLGVAEEEAGACTLGVTEPWVGIGDAESAISSSI